MSVCGEPSAGAGDVEMRPRRLVDEALQELRRGDRAADSGRRCSSCRRTWNRSCLSYSGPSGMRQTRSPVAEPGLGQALGRACRRWQNRPAYSWPSATMIAPVKRRQIDHEFRLEARVDVVQHVGQHEAAFGVGVDDLDGLARHRCDDVARPLRVAVRHVLDEADGADGVDLGLARRRARASARRRRPRPPCRPSCPPCRRPA